MAIQLLLLMKIITDYCLFTLKYWLKGLVNQIVIWPHCTADLFSQMSLQMRKDAEVNRLALAFAEEVGYRHV